MSHVPLVLDLHDRPIVIFGGGGVGERKTRHFSQYTRVKVVSLDFTPGLQALAEESDSVELVLDRITPNNLDAYLAGAFIVIPATDDPGLNDAITRRAREKGLLVNRVDSEPGDVIVPSVIQRGPVVVGISTLGHSPALSKYTRLRLERVVGEEYGLMARLQDELREELKTRVEDQGARRQILWRVLQDDEVWGALAESYSKAYNLALRYMYDWENGALNEA